MINFTHFNQKYTHISACKIVHICMVTVTLHICTVTVTLHTNVLLISHFSPFCFSLFSICKTNSGIFSPSSSSSSFDAHKHTHTHGHTNRSIIAKSTQTHHPHRPSIAKSTKNQPRTHHKINHKHTTKIKHTHS